MNLSRSRQSIVTRVLRSQSGELYRAQILVVENESGIEFRILSAQLIITADEASVKQKPLSLPFVKVKSIPAILRRVFVSKIISPFAADVTFMMSQPTRAPSK